jgi:urea transport system substrate-binding protein
MPTRRSFLKTSAAFAAMPAMVSRSASAADEIKVATIFDQSGGLDLYGKPMQTSAALAFDEVNAGGGLLGKQKSASSTTTPSRTCNSTHSSPRKHR